MVLKIKITSSTKQRNLKRPETGMKLAKTYLQWTKWLLLWITKENHKGLKRINQTMNELARATGPFVKTQWTKSKLLTKSEVSWARCSSLYYNILFYVSVVQINKVYNILQHGDYYSEITERETSQCQALPTDGIYVVCMYLLLSIGTDTDLDTTYVYVRHLCTYVMYPHIY